MKANNILKILALPLSLLILAFGIYLIWEIFNLPEREEFFQIVKNWFDMYGLWLVFGSALLEGVLLFGNYYPGGTVIFWGVIIASGDIDQTILVVAIVCVALFIAYYFNYLLGKYGWYKVLAKLGMQRAIEERKAGVAKHQFMAIMGSYWMPNLASLTSTAAGILKLPLKKFLIHSAIGVIIWNTFWGILVASLGEQAFDLISLKWALIIIGVWVLVILIKQKIDFRKSGNKYSYPVELKSSIKMTYGESPAHVGNLKHSVDFICPEGTEVHAAQDGIVVDLKSDSNKGGPDKSIEHYGNFIEIKHRGEEYSEYEHLKLNGALVKIGDKVKKGDIIGYSGATGWLAHLGPHLHFMVGKYGKTDDEYETIPIMWEKTATEPKVFIFDIFGVLCDVFNQKWEEENLISKTQHENEFSPLYRDIDLGEKTQDDFYKLASKIINKDPSEIGREMENGFTVNQALFDMVKDLNKKYKTAICSNSEASFVDKMFHGKDLRLEDYFSDIFISSDIRLLKPDPKIFKFCAEKLGVDPSECVFIDDKKKNIDNAESVGMLGYHFEDNESFKKWLSDNNF